MRKFFSKLLKFSFCIGACTISLNSQAQVKILFDATKGEMAGCGDWVIDYDSTNLGVGTGGTYHTTMGNQSNPQRIPTPPQSGITASTPETYWSGALSSWAVDCAKKGYVVETLPWSGQLTYGNTSNVQDLSHYKVLVIDEPNIKFTTAEKTALMQFVQNGGGLFMISDHTVSDRNGDGWDSPVIWNDFFTTNSVHPNPFGLSFDLANFSGTTTAVFASSTDSIIHGPMGNVTKAQWASGTSMTLDPSQNATVKGVVYKSGTSSAGNTNALVAYARYGNGKVAAMGDSSPADDSTGNTPGTTCYLYNGYWGDASGNHRLLIMNMTIWLADTTPVSHAGVEEIGGSLPNVTIRPNPSSGQISLATNCDINNASVTIFGLTGNIVVQKSIAEFKKDENITFILEPGFYLVKVESDKAIQTSRVVVY